MENIIGIGEVTTSPDSEKIIEANKDYIFKLLDERSSIWSLIEFEYDGTCKLVLHEVDIEIYTKLLGSVTEDFTMFKHMVDYVKSLPNIEKEIQTFFDEECKKLNIGVNYD